MMQQLSITAASRTKRIADNFTQNINDFRLERLNHTRVKLRKLDTGNQNHKANARKLAHMRGIGIEQYKKTIMSTT